MSAVGYVTVEEALTYIQTHYASSDALRIAWEAMDAADQAVYLQKSFDAINLMPFRGRKTSEGQVDAFPRWPDIIVPDNVKNAQVENALALSDSSTVDEAAMYERLWQYGVESYSIGNLSESSSNGAWGRAGANQDVVSKQAINYLKPYLMGGFTI